MPIRLAISHSVMLWRAVVVTDFYNVKCKLNRWNIKKVLTDRSGPSILTAYGIVFSYVA